MSEKITIVEIKDLMDKLLKATHSLAETHPKVDKTYHYVRVIEGFYRRNHFTLLAIRYLADAPALADSAAVLARKMTEDVISIEYMLLKGKEEMAKRFQDFFYIQAYQEIEHRKRLGYEIPPEEELVKLMGRVEKLKPQFWHEKSNDFMHSWSGKSAEQMWVELAKKKVFGKHDVHSVLLGYTYGSWKNHPNPVDVLTYMTNELRNTFSESALKQATILSMMDYIRLTTRYIDEIRQIKQKNVYEDINKVVKEVFGYMDDERFALDKKQISH
ncbi:hypothetical protein HYW40_00845 [Candidatus Curtissbacteria bacterium]|nr:hypothetical protein [Candidatus Curtissbacteria bacterium]